MVRLRWFARLSVLYFLVFLCGCSCTDIRREFMGLNIRDVENAKVRYSEVLSKDAGACYDIILTTLDEMDASICGEDPGNYFIRAIRFDRSYGACINTTEVAILVKPLQGTTSEVSVFSENYSLANFVAYKLFSKLKE